MLSTPWFTNIRLSLLEYGLKYILSITYVCTYSYANVTFCLLLLYLICKNVCRNDERCFHHSLILPRHTQTHRQTCASASASERDWRPSRSPWLRSTGGGRQPTTPCCRPSRNSSQNRSISWRGMLYACTNVIILQQYYNMAAVEVVSRVQLVRFGTCRR